MKTKIQAYSALVIVPILNLLGGKQLEIKAYLSLELNRAVDCRRKSACSSTMEQSTNPLYHSNLSRLAIVAATIVCGLVIAFFFLRAPIDDAYITYRYAQNLALGHGFTYNANELPILGTTAPMWALILAGFIHFGFSPETLSIILSVFVVGVALTIFFLRFAPAKLSIPASIVWILVIITYFPNRIVIFSGMESCLYLFAVIASFVAAVQGRSALAGFLAGFATLLRPDGFLAVVVCLCTNLRSGWTRRGLVMLIAYGCVTLPWAYFAITRFGSVIPHSIEAKQILYAAPIRTNFLYFFEALTQTPYDAIITCGGLAGLILSIRQPFPRAVLTWLVAYSAGIICSGVKPIFFWYFAPHWLILSTLGLGGLIEHFIEQKNALTGSLQALDRKVQLVTIAFCIMLGGGIVDAFYHQRTIDPVLIRENAYREIVRRWGERIRPGDSVLVGETGILGFGLPTATIIDSSGINSELVLQILRKGRAEIGPDKDLHKYYPWMSELVDSFQPTWIIGLRGWMQLVPLEENSEFQAQFERVDMLEEEAVGGVAVYHRRGKLPTLDPSLLKRSAE